MPMPKIEIAKGIVHSDDERPCTLDDVEKLLCAQADRFLRKPYTEHTGPAVRVRIIERYKGWCDRGWFDDQSLPAFSDSVKVFPPSDGSDRVVLIDFDRDLVMAARVPCDECPHSESAHRWVHDEWEMWCVHCGIRQERDQEMLTTACPKAALTTYTTHGWSTPKR